MSRKQSTAENETDSRNPVNSCMKVGQIVRMPGPADDMILATPGARFGRGHAAIRKIKELYNLCTRYSDGL